MLIVYGVERPSEESAPIGWRDGTVCVVAAVDVEV